jgi:hypothetical protein
MTDETFTIYRDIYCPGTIILMKIIEELTLYVIDLKKENDLMKEKISIIENK